MERWLHVRAYIAIWSDMFLKNSGIVGIWVKFGKIFFSLETHVYCMSKIIKIWALYTTCNKRDYKSSWLCFTDLSYDRCTWKGNGMLSPRKKEFALYLIEQYHQADLMVPHLFFNYLWKEIKNSITNYITIQRDPKYLLTSPCGLPVMW